ncbi:pyrophosphatase PpaX [soil metagenome]
MTSHSDYQTYIFDLDGTITNSALVWLDIFRKGLENFGVTPPSDQILAAHTHDWKQMLELGLPEAKLPEFIEFEQKLATKRLPDAPLHPGAIKMLESLKKRGKQLAIFSTNDRVIFDVTMRHHNLNRFTDVAIAGDDVEHRKPHPAGLQKALSDLGVSPSERSQAVYIGDKDTDVQAAHNAGIDSILYYPAVHEMMYDLVELSQHKPTRIIHTWAELISPTSN